MRNVFHALLCCFLLLWGGCSASKSPTALLDEVVELHRSGDVDGLLALHTHDSEFIIPGQIPIRGIAALRDLFEWDAVLGSELVMDKISVDGDSIVVGSIIERNSWFRAIGIPEARYRPGTEFVLRDGLIQGTYPSGFDDDTLARVIEAYQSIVQWLPANRPGTLERLLPGGKFRYDAESARLWLDVLEEWGAEADRNDS